MRNEIMLLELEESINSSKDCEKQFNQTSP